MVRYAVARQFLPSDAPTLRSYTSAMIEKVGYTKPVTTARPVRRTGATESTGFADALAEAEGVAGASGVAPTAPVAAMSGVGGLLGVNEVDERAVARRKAVKRGRFTLEALEGLRNALLLGTLPLSTLRNLERVIAEERALTSHPALEAILDDIELRAAVELAKLEMAGLLPPAQ